MLEAGQEAPDFTLPDQDGREFTLSGQRNMGLTTPSPRSTASGARSRCTARSTWA